MLPRINRLKKQIDFKRVATRGRGFFIYGISCKTLPNRLHESRYAIVVSKKTHKHATKRNYIRRRISEIIRKNQTDFKNGTDIIIMVNKDILKTTHKELQEMVFNLFKKAFLYK